ncbi:MAG: tetratricopeptide repeat protein [Burkholderiales bacterium]
MMPIRRTALLAALLAGLSLIPVFSARADELQSARQLISQGRYADAQQAVDRELASHPGQADIRLLKGMILANLGKTEEAIKLYIDLVRDYPQLPEPRNNLAVLYATQGRYDKARLELEAAMRTNPSYATTYGNLSEVYGKMASQAYDKALQLDKSGPAPQSRLSLLTGIYGQGGAVPQLPAQREPAEAAAPLPVKPASPPPAKPAVPLPAAARPPVAEAAKPVVVAAASPEKVKPVPAKPVEAKPAKPAPSVKAEKEHAPDESEDILLAVNAWARDWSSRNANAYLSHYAKDFNPGRQSRADWEKSRRERVTAPKHIKVTISSARVKLENDGRASVSFRQSYDAGHLQTSTGKTLVMVKNGKRWLIQQERIGR